jgi:hypothetical protein
MSVPMAIALSGQLLHDQQVIQPALRSSPSQALQHMSSWTSVNPILYTSPIPTLLNGILLHTPSHGYARLVMRSTGAWEEATSTRGLKPDKGEAWKRR